MTEESTHPETIFMDEAVFKDSYVPKYILYRDRERRFFEEHYSWIFKGLGIGNLVIIGDVGTGKTLITRDVLTKTKHRCDAESIPFGFYITNCTDLNTTYKILEELLKRKNIITKLRRDRARALDLFENYVANYQYYILVLDEFDRFLLRSKQDADAFLYTCSRSIPNISLVLISRNFTIMYLENYLDPSTLDTFRHTSLIFQGYTPSDLQGILLERMRLGLVGSAWDLDVIDYLVGAANTLGEGARGAIHICREAVKYATVTGATKITKEHIDAVTRDILVDDTVQSILDLPTLIRAILFRVYTQEEPQYFNSIADWYNDTVANTEFRASKRSFHRYVTKLNMMGILRKVQKGTRVILKVNDDFLPAVARAYKKYVRSVNSSTTERVL